MTNSASAAAPAAASLAPAVSPSSADAIIAAASALLPHLERGVSIDAATLRSAMETSFGGSDAEGHWDWKSAYEACEVAQILFLRKFGPALDRHSGNPAALLVMIEKITRLFPTHTRRSQTGQALQQFSTPVGLGTVAAIAAAITPTDVVLEPSAGTGLLAIHAQRAGALLVLNEFADTRAELLERLFAEVAVSRYDAAQIDDYLDSAIRPSVVLMNPPFSAMAHVDHTMKDAALRHLSSALARLTEGGRLVAITGAGFGPELPAWRDEFIKLQARGRVLFSAAIDGRAYAKHGTSVDRPPPSGPV